MNYLQRWSILIAPTPYSKTIKPQSINSVTKLTLFVSEELLMENKLGILNAKSLRLILSHE